MIAKHSLLTIALVVFCGVGIQAHAKPPIVLDAMEVIEAGKLRFVQNCAYCHGAEGVGGKHKQLQCRDFDNDYLFDVISNGLSRGSFFMPPWDQMSEEKRWELVAYIQSLSKLEKCE